MHRAWQIPELTMRIVEECAPFSNRRGSYPPSAGGSVRDHCALVSLALTCRHLQEYALDVLWYYQPGMHELLRLLPDDLWEEELSTVERGDDAPGDLHSFMRLVST